MTDDFRSTDLWPADTRRLDELFQMTQRGPFSGADRLEQITNETADMPPSFVEDHRFMLELAGYIAGGVHNDRFIHGPPDGDATDLDNVSNKLPGWIVVDSTTNSGRVEWNKGANDEALLTFYATNPQAGDTLYIQQDVYVSGGNFALLSPVLNTVATATAVSEGVTALIGYEWVYPDGTVSGLVDKAYTLAAEEQNHRLWLVTSSRSYAHLRLHLGVIFNSNYASGEMNVMDLRWVWVNKPETYDVTLPWVAMSPGWSSSSTNNINFFSDHGSLPFGAARWPAPGPGLLTSVSAFTNTAPSAGTVSFYAKIAGSSTESTMACTLTAGDTKAAASRDPYGVQDFDFATLDRFAMQGKTNGSFSETGSPSYTGTLVVTIVNAFVDATTDSSTGSGYGIAGSG